jgi:hypothetical protein
MRELGVGSRCEPGGGLCLYKKSNEKHCSRHLMCQARELQTQSLLSERKECFVWEKLYLLAEETVRSYSQGNDPKSARAEYGS